MIAIDKKLALLKIHASKFAKCSERLCKAEEEADRNKSQTLISKMGSFLTAKAHLNKSKERIALLRCRYENCREDTKNVLADILEHFKGDPMKYKKGQALLRKKNARAEEYIKFMQML